MTQAAAAATPATTGASSTNGSGTGSRNVVPSEVGWQFVPQYYTFMNKQPDRLHCFYTKQSTYTHGTEGEDVTPCHGQADIHAKISSLNLVDCKVFIHSVDAQASLGGGIVIQVIGEMSNQEEAWRKFVQTFFLAEQPNGYFVLNDVFRFLKEEGVDEDPADESGDVQQETAPETTPAVEVTPEQNFIQQDEAEEQQPLSVTSKSPVPEPAAAPAPVPDVTTATSAISDESEHASAVAGDWVQVDSSESATDAPAPVASSESEETKPITPTPAEPETTTAPVPPVNGSARPSPSPAPPAAAATPPATEKPAQQQPAAPAPAPPQPPGPPKPKTWANLAASNSRAWGSTAASAVASSTAPSPGPAAAAAGSGPKPVQRTASAQGSRPNPGTPLQGIASPSVFIKGVIDPLSNELLQSSLAQRFGPIKEIEVVRSKACAFAEFASIDSARRAIQASLPQSQGGEGGVRIECDNQGTVRINIETRKERGDRPPPSGPPRGTGRGGFESGRGGANDGRGSFRGRGRGRGAPIGGK